MALLEVNGVSVSFGGLAALQRVTLSVEPGEIVGVIGPNGAGKTTLFNAITGFVRPQQGSIRFKGQELIGLSTDEICRRGVARTFQLVRIFPALTVVEHVLVGLYFGREDGEISDAEAKDLARELLNQTGLEAFADREARQLPVADRKRLELARALATRPELLLLDELIASISAEEARRLLGLIWKIRNQGVAVLMIEHIMKAVMGLSDRIVVLHHGEKIADGPPEAVSQSRVVVEAYLGKGRR